MKHPVCQNFLPFPMALLCLMLLGFSSAGNTGKLYKWVDENGEVRYGDQLPPSEVKNRHQTLNAQGIVISTTEASKTPEEYAAIRKAEKERKEIEAVEKSKKDFERKKDMALLMTFDSVDELERAKDNKMEVVDLVIQLIYKSMAIAQERLEVLEGHAETLYLSKGLQVPGGLAQNIEILTRANVNRQERLQQRLIEKNKILARYQKDLTRYRILTGELPGIPLHETN